LSVDFRTVPIPIIPDTINEINQEFALDLEVVNNTIPVTTIRSTTTMRIEDNDGKYKM